jgi:hypothetical protein
LLGTPERTISSGALTHKPHLCYNSKMITRICKGCGETKEITNFHLAKSGIHGRNAYCKPCRAARSKCKYSSDLFTYIVRLKKYQSKKLQVPFDLTREYLESIWDWSCDCCKTPLTRGDKTSNTQYALDRVFPSRGYTKGNVCLLCARCNRIKYDATADELLTIGDWLKNKERSTTISKESTHKCVEAPSTREILL